MIWALHHGDCLDPVTGLASLADRSVDHVIMDPPYSAETHDKALHIDRYDGAKPRDQIVFSPMQDYAATAQQITRAARRWIVVFGDLGSVPLWRDALVAAGCSWARFGFWWKTDAQPQTTGDRPAQGGELIGLAHAPRPPKSGRMRWNGGGRHFRYQFPSQDGIARGHPTQKPIDLMTALVRDFTDRGETVLDPFAGSGTTGVAAIQCGRSFVGWERDAKYHAVATSRLSEAREQPELFGVAKARRAKTPDLFGGGA